MTEKPQAKPFDPEISEAGYVARSEGVGSPRMRDLARKIFADPGARTPEEMRKLAAAVLAFHKNGRS